jgi:transcription elongation factor SPT5
MSSNYDYEEEEDAAQEEDNEEYFEDYDEEEEEEDGNPSKRRRVHANPFVDMEAAHDDEEEEEEEEAEEGFIDHSEEIAKGPRRPMPYSVGSVPAMDRGARAQSYLSNLEQRYAGMDEEEIDEYEDELVEDMETLGVDKRESRGPRMGGPMAMKVRREADLPTTNDPKLFIVRCAKGKEKRAVALLLQKYLHSLRDKRNRLRITSALCVEGFKGSIYVEAMNETQVRNAIRGMSPLISETKVQLVPLHEMADVLKPGKKTIEVKKGDWVRVKRGIYKGDIAQVFDIDESRGVACIKIIPRLNPDGTQPSATQIHNRPPQRLLNEQEIQDEIIKKKDPRSNLKFVIYQGKKFKDGYMYKLVNIKSLEAKNIQPTLEELQLFHRSASGDSEIQLNNLAEALRKNVALRKGDMVTVIDGELIGVKGVVHEVNSDSVIVIPKDKSYHGPPMVFSPPQLQKYFEEGSFCKVISGKYEGETGYVVSSDRDTVTLYSDMKKQEMKVFVSDLQLASTTEETQTKVGGFNLYDMIRIDNNTMAVVIKSDKDVYKVLDNNGVVRSLRLQEMGPKRNTRDGYRMLDKNATQFGVGDSLRVVDGPYKGREGVAKQLFRAFVFIHARDVVENSGIFVTRADFCEVRGNRMAQQGSMAPPKPPSGLRGVAFKGRSTHPLMDKTVRIRRGPYKGYLGIVKDVADQTARVELHSQMKIVNVSVNDVKEDAAENQKPATTYPTRSVYRGDDGGRTPRRVYLDTPNPYLETPRTPSHDRIWNPNAPNTPMYPRDDEDTDPFTGTPAVTPSAAPYSSNTDTGQQSSFRPPITPGVGTYPYQTPHETPAPYSRDYHYRTPGPGYPTTPGSSLLTPVNTPGSDLSMSHPLTSSAYTPNPSYPHKPITPGAGINPVTPGNPITPGTNQPYTSTYTPYSVPITPSVNYSSGYGSASAYDNTYTMHPSNWVAPGMKVRIEGNTAHHGYKGYIKSVNPQAGICVVVLENEDEKEELSANIKIEYLKPGIPRKDDTVLIIKPGESKGKKALVLQVQDEGVAVRMMHDNTAKTFSASECVPLEEVSH